MKEKVYEVNINELKDDPHNANKGTERGQYMIDASVAKTGLHRGVFVDKNDTLVGGNKTRQAAIDAGFKKAIVVETDGDTLVVTKRRDFDLTDNDPENPARLAAYYDNRSSQLNLDFDPEVLLADMTAGLPLDEFWFDWELESFADDLANDSEWGDALNKLPNEDRTPFQQMTFTLHDTQVELVKSAVKLAKSMGVLNSVNENSNGNGLARICEAFVNANS